MKKQNNQTNICNEQIPFPSHSRKGIRSNRTSRKLVFISFVFFINLSSEATTSPTSQTSQTSSFTEVVAETTTSKEVEKTTTERRGADAKKSFGIEGDAATKWKIAFGVCVAVIVILLAGE